MNFKSKKERSELMRQMGSLGGKATAKRYTHEQLAEWGREGAKKRQENKAKAEIPTANL